jgi:hypothetical protein
MAGTQRSQADGSLSDGQQGSIPHRSLAVLRTLAAYDLPSCTRAHQLRQEVQNPSQSQKIGSAVLIGLTSVQTPVPRLPAVGVIVTMERLLPMLQTLATASVMRRSRLTALRVVPRSTVATDF